MAARRSTQSARQMTFCRFCKQEFITYKAAGPSQCPRCGRPVGILKQRRLLRLLALAILVGVIVALALAYRAWR